MTTLLVLLSALTCLVSGWMGSMYLLLRHPQYMERAGMSLGIFIGAAAVASGGYRGPAALRSILGVWAAGVLALGLWGVFGGGDDGWSLIAGGLFAAEGSVALVSILKASVSAGTA